MTQTKVEAPFVENNRPFRNLIINGDMQISQRSASPLTASGDSNYSLDRWKFTREGTFGDAQITVTQDTDVPTGEGFAKSLKCVCATADTSVASNTISYIEQRFEGQNLQSIAKGTSGAKKMTYSFFCKSNLTGTFTINFLDQDNTRQFSTSYSLASANTWERIIINVPADTTGALDNDNDSSFTIQMNLQAGTDKSNGALATAFEASAQGDRGVGQTNFFSSTSNNWYITGVQWEVGDAATDFEFLPFDVQLQRCLRYFFRDNVYTSGVGATGSIASGQCHTTTRFDGQYDFPVLMRARPTGSVSDATKFRVQHAGSQTVATAMTIEGDGVAPAFKSTMIYTTVSSGLTAGRAGNIIHNNATAYIDNDAEL